MTDAQKAQIERINQVSAMARTSWITLLAYLAFIGVTLLAVEDADFFVPSRKTSLPLVGVDIPTASFFTFAPILAAALYVYLHVVLLKLWDAIADISPKYIDGQPLGDHLNPWLVNDWALTLKGGAAAPARPLRSIGNRASILLVWAAAPLVLVGFWWRSMPAHDELLTLLLGACFLIALHAGVTNWLTARAWLAHPRIEPSYDHWWKSPSAWLVLMLVASASWLRTEGGFDHVVNKAIDLAETAYKPFFESGTYQNGDEKPAQTVQEEWIAEAAWIPKLDWFDVTNNAPFVGRWIDHFRPWNPLSRTDLSNVEMIDLPEIWRTSEVARHAYRETWCKREGLGMEICDHLPDTDHPVPAYVTIDREIWCKDHEISAGDPCAAGFAQLDDRFKADWDTERDSGIANLPKLNLADRDLRRAFAPNVTLVWADLTGARLEGADLREARLEGADLLGARLEGADLSHARLERANLMAARLEGADFRKSKWAGASNRGSPAHFADFRAGQDLTQALLNDLIGNDETLLPDTPAPDTGLAFYIPSCWATPPDGFDVLVARWAASSDGAETLRAAYLCAEGEAPRKTGTPCPVDLPREVCPAWWFDKRYVEGN